MISLGLSKGSRQRANCSRFGKRPSFDQSWRPRAVDSFGFGSQNRSVSDDVWSSTCHFGSKKKIFFNAIPQEWCGVTENGVTRSILLSLKSKQHVWTILSFKDAFWLAFVSSFRTFDSSCISRPSNASLLAEVQMKILWPWENFLEGPKRRRGVTWKQTPGWRESNVCRKSRPQQRMEI